MSTLKELRKKAGLTLTELAGLTGTTAPQISRLEKGERKLTKQWADRLAPALGCLPQELMFGSGSFNGIAASAQTPYALGDAYPLSLALDIPVYKAVFNGGDCFCGLDDQPIDYVRRLPRLAHARNVFALYAENNTMAPRFEQGDIFYATPGHPPKPGDYAVIELLRPAKQLDDRGYIKRLISLSTHTIVVEQFNQPRRFELDTVEIKALFRIIPWNELVAC